MTVEYSLVLWGALLSLLCEFDWVFVLSVRSSISLCVCPSRLCVLIKHIELVITSETTLHLPYVVLQAAHELWDWAGRTRSYLYKITYKPSKLSQSELGFGLWSEFISSSVGLCMQDYKSLCVAVICDTLVNTQTDRYVRTWTDSLRPIILLS